MVPRPAFADGPERLADLDASVRESSGLAASWARPGWVWTHGDSGTGPNLVRFNPADGASERFRLRGAVNVDWEDMASFRRGDTGWLAVGDVGDNLRKRGHLVLYVVPEPVEGADTGAGIDVAHVVRFAFDDGARDCEALAVEPDGSAAWLVSKEVNAHGTIFGFSGVYRLDLSFLWGDAPADPRRVHVAERRVTLDWRIPTAADISPDGRLLMLGSYADGMLYRRVGDASWGDVMSGPVQRVTLPPRRQGEGLCFEAGGEAVYLSSEQPGQPIWRVPVPGPDGP